MGHENLPKWTVLYNIISEGSTWVGTGWEFFDHEAQAKACFDKQVNLGNCPTMRPFHFGNDFKHTGAAHQFWYSKDK